MCVSYGNQEKKDQPFLNFSLFYHFLIYSLLLVKYIFICELLAVFFKDVYGKRFLELLGGILCLLIYDILCFKTGFRIYLPNLLHA